MVKKHFFQKTAKKIGKSAVDSLSDSYKRNKSAVNRMYKNKSAVIEVCTLHTCTVHSSIFVKNYHRKKMKKQKRCEKCALCSVSLINTKKMV